MKQLAILGLCIVYAVLNVGGATIISSVTQNAGEIKGAGDIIKILLSFKTISGFLVIALSAPILLKVLQMGDFSYVMPMAVGMHFLFSILSGIIIAKDRPSLLSYIGMVLVISGIVFMSAGQNYDLAISKKSPPQSIEEVEK